MADIDIHPFGPCTSQFPGLRLGCIPLQVFLNQRSGTILQELWQEQASNKASDDWWGKPKVVATIKRLLGITRLGKSGFNISEGGELTARRATVLNSVKEEMLSASGVAKVVDTELQEIMENTEGSMNDLITQFKMQGQTQFEETLPTHEPLGLDKELKRIHHSLKVEAVKKFSWKSRLRGKSTSFPKSVTTQNMMMAFEKISGSKSPS